MTIRYGTYGKLPNKELPYRMAIGNGKSDFITVGKLDNTYHGVYTHPIENFDILKDFHFKNDGIEFGMGAFNLTSDWVNGKAGILDDQFNIESKALDFNLILKTWKENHGDEPPVFEITNEPNLFPYMSPTLYAYYYIKWWDFIKSKVPNAKIMNGGLFILDMLPSFVTDNMGHFGITYSKVVDYYLQFVNIIKKVDYKYVPNILNLHFYPYVHKKGGMYTLEQHVNQLNTVIKDLDGYYKEVWLTEFGNINPKDIHETYQLVREMLELFEKVPINRCYYFKARGVDTNLLLLKTIGKKYYDKILLIQLIINCLLKAPTLFFIRSIFDFILKLFKLPKINDIVTIIDVVTDYIKNIPIQSLTDEQGRLNYVGELYVKNSNRKI